MLFSSWEYLLFFLPLAVTGYFLCQRWQRPRLAQGWLVLCSWYFLASWNVGCLLLLWISLGCNFALTRLLQRTAWQVDTPQAAHARQLTLMAGVTINLLLLAYFKYVDFFLASVQQLGGPHWDFFHIALPLAVSFYTLQQIGLLMDVYERLVVQRSFWQHALFVSFFPTLVSGPITRFREVMPQFADAALAHCRADNIARGLFLLTIGLCKKVVLADTLAQYVDAGFSHAAALSVLEGWLSCFAFTLQMYFDFSGYSDMAIGSALLCNIRLPANFRSPLGASNLITFWSQWHITLTRFINAYVYTPLVRALSPAGRRGVPFAAAMVATLLAMLVSGLWHGANLTFVVWGGLHGVGLVINHVWRRYRWPMPAWLGRVLVFVFVSLALVYFRAESITQAHQLFAAMSGSNAVPWANETLLQQTGLSWLLLRWPMLASPWLSVALLMAGVAMVQLKRNSLDWCEAFVPSWRFALWQVFCLTLSLLLLTGDDSHFLYFKF